MAKKEKERRQKRKRAKKARKRMDGSTCRKAKIPAALREQVWISQMGRKFEGKCCVDWCTNTITVFDFQSGHNIPESKGGKTTLENLIPICGRCNLSMGNQYTIDQWCKQFSENVVPVTPKRKRRFWCI